MSSSAASHLLLHPLLHGSLVFFVVISHSGYFIFTAITHVSLSSSVVFASLPFIIYMFRYLNEFFLFFYLSLFFFIFLYFTIVFFILPSFLILF